MSDENIIDWLRSTSGLGATHPALGGYTSRHGEAADDIIRLTAELKGWEDIEDHEAMQCYLDNKEKDKRIEELEERWRLAQASMAMDKSRIEELEVKVKTTFKQFLHLMPTAHIITEEQIDGLVEYAEEILPVCERCNGAMWCFLGKLNIVACEGCFSCMEKDTQAARNRPDCNGHRWRITEVSDE